MSLAMDLFYFRVGSCAQKLDVCESWFK